MGITEVWVDTALALGEKSLKTMERIVKAQSARIPLGRLNNLLRHCAGQISLSDRRRFLLKSWPAMPTLHHAFAQP